MNAGDAIDALMDVLVADVVTVNNALAGTGYQLSVEPGIAEDDTSEYRYIKRGDRMKLPDGLTVCFVPESGRKTDYLTQNVSERTATVQIVAYLVNERDPDGRERARYALADTLRMLYNRSAMRTLQTPRGVFYGCEATDELYRYDARMGEARFGQVAAMVILTWTGIYHVEETETHG